MTQEEREKLREKIRQDMEDFIKSGGQVIQVPAGKCSREADFNSYSDKDEV